MRNILILLLFIQYGCASNPYAADQNDRVAKAFSVLKKSYATEKGEKLSFKMYYVISRGAKNDANFVALSNTSGPSSSAKELASVISQAAQSKIKKVVVTGPSTRKTEQVISDAFLLLKDKKYDGLEFYYLAEKEIFSNVRKIIIRSGAKYIFIKYK